MLGFAPLATAPLTVIPNETTGLPAGYIGLAVDGAPGRFLVEIDGNNGAPVTLYFGDRDWTGAPDDADRPNQFYDGRCSQPYQFEQSLPVGVDRGATNAVQVGDLALHDEDGAASALFDGVDITGHEVRVYYDPAPDFASATLVLQAKATGLDPAPGVLRVLLESAAPDLDVPAQPRVYLGTGGAEGGAAHAGRTMPQCLGYCPNVAADNIDSVTADHIHRVHGRGVQRILAARDNASAWTPTGQDYPDYAALRAAVVPAGYFSTCHADGLFKPGSAPFGQVTADVLGDSVGGYVDSTGDIAKRFLADIQGHGYGALVEDGFDSLPGGTTGIFRPAGSTATAREIMAALLNGVLGWYGSDALGRFTAGRLYDPAPIAPTVTLTQNEILSLEPMASPAPRWRQTALYRRNWTLQTSVAGIAENAEYGLPGRVVPYEDVAVKARAPGADEGEDYETLFYNRADALGVATRVVTLHGAALRRMFAVTVPGIGYAQTLGAVLRVQYPDYGLDAGKTFLVVSKTERAVPASTVFWIWG